MSGRDTSIEDAECQCSLIERCALCKRSGAATSAYDDGLDHICGHVRNRCAGCGVCRSCDGCYCDEDYDDGPPRRTMADNLRYFGLGYYRDDD
ncbi:hypothetical protein [Saccharothrix stipae]